MKKITRYAREHRKAPTKAEKELKRKLLNWRIRFRSQRQFDFFIVDFLIPDRRLVIEVDGEYHRDAQDYDERRTKYLNSLGLEVVRVDNATVLTTNCETLREITLSYPLQDISNLPLRNTYGVAKY